ncbi:MAG: hypothetical protein LUC85_01670 [Bacteroidales bacterium]|nr:hypothetical protein [Bacteroidales bacterium]MCD8393527.1 hypothetical protein [Bacteroidales bacterium]
MEENEQIYQEEAQLQEQSLNEEPTATQEDEQAHDDGQHLTKGTGALGEASDTVEQATSPRIEPAVTRVDLEEVLAAAERRGYLKGRNERIEELMSRPRELEAPTQSPQTLILNHIRRSIWD